MFRSFERKDTKLNPELLRFNLQFFANDEGGEKTEEATPKKLDDARKEGQVAKSQELGTAVTLIALFGGLKVFVGVIAANFTDAFGEYYNSIETYSKGGPFTSNYASAFVNGAMGSVLISCLPMFAVAVVFAIVINVAQVRWQPTLKPLIPKFSKLNPINGFKRIISMDKLVELLKAVIKIGLIAYLAYSELTESAGLVNSLYDTDLFDAVAMIGKLVIDFGFRVAIIYLVIGLADYIYQKFKFNKDMRMTKQEIKDEFKQTEGDPKIKGQIRQRMREASQRRMMQQLPEADVVITNPTHLACAIKYDKSRAEAPILLAKGADYLAMKIKEEAKKNNIPIVENKPLARMLYHNVELNEEIPEELYQMTAEVLAYVYSLKEGAYATT
ncbi:MAG: flagellar biosynthesis protein FlhB [Lachnospiraceae bacterium]|nr:flagellar biosynthesis protein FlhB [Lachnospiraceae bacterium]